MKFNLLFFAVLFGVFCAGAEAQKAAAAKVDPTKDVRAAFDRIAEGIRQSDAEKVMGVYEKRDDILFFNNNGSVTRGWQTMKDNRVSSYAKAKNVSLDITGLNVQMLGLNAAYVTCKWKQDQEYDGKLESASGRMTLVFKKIGKDWKVVHLHTSPDNPGPTRPILDSEKTNENPGG
ncbi:MAG: YybH family protein [Pyrinomonadaceae bacterium]